MDKTTVNKCLLLPQRQDLRGRLGCETLQLSELKRGEKSELFKSQVLGPQ